MCLNLSEYHINNIKYICSTYKIYVIWAYYFVKQDLFFVTKILNHVMNPWNYSNLSWLRYPYANWSSGHISRSHCNFEYVGKLEIDSVLLISQYKDIPRFQELPGSSFSPIVLSLSSWDVLRTGWRGITGGWYRGFLDKISRIQNDHDRSPCHSKHIRDGCWFQ